MFMINSFFEKFFGTKLQKRPDKFDCTIEITRMLDLIKSGWNFYSTKEFLEYFKGKKMDYLVGIIGDKFSGKTFILSKILGNFVENPDLRINPSLFFKTYKDYNLVFLDSLGSNLTPKFFLKNLEIMDKDETEIEKMKRQKDNEITTKINELFIRNFVLEISELCIYVISYLGGNELERLNSIKQKFTDKVIIIHNLVKLTSLEEIDFYYEAILKRELNLEKRIIMNTNYCYYISKEINENKEILLLHLILGNDNDKEVHDYNSEILDFLKTQIKTKSGHSFDFMKKFKNFFQKFNLQYFDLKTKISEKELSNFVNLKDSIKLYEESDVIVQNNKIISPLVEKEKIINLRFKNINLDFISGKKSQFNVNEIKKYKVYATLKGLIIEFYPEGDININDIKYKIHRAGKQQKIEIFGDYVKNTNKNNYNEIIYDTISMYNQFLFQEYILKRQFLLGDINSKELINGKLIINIKILNFGEENDEEIEV